jgi:asparagine N-glycosylation enzyme membrane subunit Stt3
LPRTIAGIPEKESVAFFFIFLAFYFFLESFTAIKIKRALIFGILAGIATGLLALIWGGVTYVFITIAGAVLFAFLLGKIKKKEFYAYALWIIGFSLTMIPFSLRYDLRSLISSTSTGIAIGVFFILLIDFAFGQFSFSDKIYSRWKKVPKEIISIIISGILLIALASIVLGPSFISHISKDIIEQTVHPLEISRWGLTVAENKQPYFINDWKDNFGPVISGIPLYFWLFFIGSIYLFNYLIKSLNKKEKLILNFAYFIFLISLIFSRYSSGSILNGDTGLSFVVYFGGAILFLISFAYVYFKRHANDNFEVFKEFDIAYILYFIILTIAIIGARGAIRLIMVLGAVTPLVVSSFNVKLGQRFFNEKGGMIKLVIGIILLIVALSSLFTIWTYYKSDKAIGENFAPGPYQWQWQKAMQWVRNNVPENAVFAHCWDYGYWVQSIGQRSTILDGGNAIVYWNYLMGRHVLTAPTDAEGLEFLYSHNATHLLIDSTEIGKYTAFSSIGSDENYDRYSWLSVFLMDDSQTRETNNETMYVYPGGTLLDGDIIWKQDGKDILLPKKKAGIGAIILIKDSKENYLQPNAIFIYGGQQYKIPLKYLFIENNLKDFGSGLEAGVFTFSRIDSNSQGGINLNMIGSAIYLSEKTINSNLARLYLFGQDSKYFKLIHSQPSYINEVLNQQGAQFGDFVFYQGFQGPIKIWEINYPEGIKSNPEYLEKGFPNKELTLAKPGEY